MLIPTAFQRLPSPATCFNGELLLGGALVQMCSALAQLQRAKFLNEAHYHVGRSVISSEGGRRFLFAAGELKGATTYNFLYRSSPLSERLAISIQYTAANFEFTAVSITAELRDTAGNSYTGSVLDVGCEFTEADLEANIHDISVAFTGCDLIQAPTNINPEPPRPLYIPSANRGEVLNIVITTTQAIPLTLSIYDIYVPEVTP